MSPRIGIGPIVCSFAALAGCAVVGSERLHDGTPGAAGVAYMLPKALLPVQLVDKGGAFELSMREPVVVGDTTQRFVLKRSGNVFSSDHVEIAVDPATGLLSSVNVTAEDQTIPALVKLVAAKAQPESADVVTEPALVFRGLLDPSWSSDEIAKFNKEINDTAKFYVERITSAAVCSESDSTENCKQIKKLKPLVGDGTFRVAVNATTRNATAAGVDCGVGICYRINVPHGVTLSGPGVSNSAIATLPNGSPTFAFPLERWAFVKTTHNVMLQSGTLKSATTDRPSSALALAAAPVDATKAVLGAVGEIVQLKIDLSGKEKALADARVAKVKAKSDLEKALVEKSSGKAEAAIFGSERRSDTFLSISVGERNISDAKSGMTRGKPGDSPQPPNPGTGTTDGRMNPGNPGTGK